MGKKTSFVKLLIISEKLIHEHSLENGSRKSNLVGSEGRKQNEMLHFCNGCCRNFVNLISVLTLRTLRKLHARVLQLMY